MLKSLAEHYQFDPEPFGDLPAKVQEVLLRASGKTEIEFRYMNDRGDVVVRKHPFEGILHNMERRYRETESNSVREELSKYIANRSCTSCGGSRLREEARHVFVDNRNLPPSPNNPSAMRWSSRLALTGQRAQIADKILKEIVERLGFLVNGPPNYLSLSRSAETLSGGEAPAHPLGEPDRCRSGGGQRMCWMSPPSACTSGTTSACSRPSGDGQHAASDFKMLESSRAKQSSHHVDFPREGAK